jgi:hypothetical protein
MYAFLIKHLGLDATPVLGDDGTVDEAWAQVASLAALHVFDTEHPVTLRSTLAELAATLQRLQQE